MTDSRVGQGLSPRIVLPVVLLGFALIVRQAATPLTDPDSFWHLRLGQLVWATRSVHEPTESWSQASDTPWVMTQWLPEVVIWRLHTWGGYPILAVAMGLALLGIALALYSLARRSAGVLASGLVTITVVLAMSASLSPRPHLVTYLLLALTVRAWLSTKNSLRPPWWLIPMTWVWSMSHGMWFIGPLTGVVLAIALSLDKHPPRAVAMRWLAVPVLSIVAASLTPVGPKLLAAPFAVAGVGGFITEWQPPDFRMIAPAVGAVIAALIVVSWARSDVRVEWCDLALLAMGVGWLLLATRTGAIGAVLMAPLLATTIQRGVARERELPSNVERVVLIAGCLSLVCVLAAIAPRVADEPHIVSAEIDKSLEELPNGTTVLNDYALGGWLRWRHPALRPTIDGLTEAYSRQYLRDYGRLTAVAAGWPTILTAWDPSAAVLATGSPLATALIADGWEVVGDDGAYVVLRRR